MIRFYIAFYMAKLAKLILKICRRNGTHLPGKVALKICPNFLQYIAKPEKIIVVTGTNGKTTVSNLLDDCFEKSGKKVINNRFGGNIIDGICVSFLMGTGFTNKSKADIAVIEMDERSSQRVLPYLKPTYLLCTNLFRDSIRRNAHPDFIFNIINSAIPEETKLILNADDLISSQLGTDKNEKTYFAIDKLPTDLSESINIINDVRICPKCSTKLKYNYVRYHHIGNAYCPNCDFKSPVADYRMTKIDYENKQVEIEANGEKTSYKMLSDSIFNMYNMLAVVTVLNKIGIETEKIKELLDNEQIAETRYKKETVNGINIIRHLAKGQNPIACSCVFDYIKKEKGQKEIILLLYDHFDAKESSESIVWLYDCDFEFLNDDSISKIVIGGPRCEDFYLRLLIAGVPSEKLVYTQNPIDTVNSLSIENGKDIYVLYDVYTDKEAKEVSSKIKEKIQNK